MYRLSIKNSQSEFVNTGMLFQSTYYVDNYYKSTGIETCCFSTAISGTSDALTNGGKINQTTIAYACKNNSSIKGTPLKASGLIYKQSPVDRYGRADNFSSETRLYPYSSREDKAIGFLKKGVIEISYISNINYINSANRHHIYRTYDIALDGTVTVLPSENIVQFSIISVVSSLKYGDKVDIDGSTYWVTSINEVLGQITISSVIVAGVTAVGITMLSQIEDPIYLNNEPTITIFDKGMFMNTENFPWTPIPTSNSDELLQIVGYIESPIAIRVDIGNSCSLGGSNGSETLVGLLDTNIVTPSDQEVLKYDNASSMWINSPEGISPSFTETITQIANGFSQNDVIAHDGTSYVLADASNSEEVIFGIITEIINADTFILGKIGYTQNSGLTSLLATVDADNILYLGLNGSLVPDSDVSLIGLDKIPVLKYIESDKGEILTSTQYVGFKDTTYTNVVHFGETIAEGSWKILIENSLLKYYRYEAGIWVLKNTFGASIISDSFVLEDSSGQMAFERPFSGRQTLLKPSIDGFGAVLGNPGGRIGLVSHGEHTLAYPKTADATWIVDNAGVGAFSAMGTYYEESNVISEDEISYEIRIYASAGASKFRFALLNAADNSILLQNLTSSEYDLEIGIEPLLVGENTIVLKYPIAFTKGLNIKVTLETPTNTSIELGADAKSANSVYRKYAKLGTLDYSLKWRTGQEYLKEEIVHIEAIDTNYNISLTGKYSCASNHIAGVDFESDLLLGKWKSVLDYSEFNYFSGTVDEMSSEIVQNIDDTINISEREVRIYNNSSFTGVPKKYIIPDAINLTLANNTTNYLVVNYNSGSPEFQIIQDVGLINESDIVPVYTIYREDSILHKISWNSLAKGLANKINARLVKTDRFKKESGLFLSEFGTRNMLVDAGNVWYGGNRISTDAVDSTITNYRLFYHSSPTTWTSTLVSQYNNLNYDDGTGGLKVLLNNNRYNCTWVFRGVEDDKEVYMVLGPQFAKYADADISTLPEIPDVIKSHCILIGRIICQKNLVAEDIQNLTDYAFISSSTNTGATTGWKDNIQLFSAAKGKGTNEPTWSDMGNGQYAYKFTVNDELFITYHVNHDYKQGTDAFPHIHFLADSAMNIGQQITWQFGYVIAKGHSQGQSLTVAETVFNMTYTATGTEVAGEHIVLECSDLQAFDLIEPDTIIMSRIKLISENVSGDIFGIMCDLHYQSESDATINKEPDFYI